MTEIIKLSHKEFLKIDKDYSKAAKVADLIYVNDKDPGIKRIKKGTGFAYIYDNKPLKDKKEIERIRKLAIPPVWTNVWICPKENGHIQATGFDIRNPFLAFAFCFISISLSIFFSIFFVVSIKCII